MLTLQALLQEHVVGQDHALEAVAQRIRSSRASLEDPGKPKGVFLFVGPSGVGKTETALALADALYGGERKLVTINMSEYQEVHSVSGLIRETWGCRPLQLQLLGDQLAGEHFFDRLEQARNRGRAGVAALEVFHMCMLLGFQGRYLLEGPERLKYLSAQVGEQIAHIRGSRAQFAPNWAPPDRISHILRRETPLWVAAALAGCLALLAYTGLELDARRTTRSALETFNGVVRLPPRAPHLSFTLP